MRHTWRPFTTFNYLIVLKLINKIGYKIHIDLLSSLKIKKTKK